MDDKKEQIIELLEQEVEKQGLLLELEQVTGTLKRKFEKLEKRRVKLGREMEFVHKEEIAIRNDIDVIVTKRTSLVREVTKIKQEPQVQVQQQQQVIQDTQDDDETDAQDWVAIKGFGGEQDSTSLSSVSGLTNDDDDDEEDEELKESFLKLFRESFTVTLNEEDVFETTEFTKWMRKNKVRLSVKEAHAFLKLHYDGLVWKTVVDFCTSVNTVSTKKFRRCIVGLRPVFTL